MSNGQILNADSEDSAFVIDDYPYGWKLRTKKRCWIETTERGQRVVEQTMNPKTGKWNNPKKSTYSSIVVMFLDDKKHVCYSALDARYSDMDKIVAFGERWSLSDYQRGVLKDLFVIAKAGELVTVDMVTREFKHKVTGKIVSSVPMMDIDDYEKVGKVQSKEEKQEIWKTAMNYAFHILKKEGVV